MLMLRFDHRLSKDIDIFTHDAQALSFITPRLNAVSERLKRPTTWNRPTSSS